MKTKMSKSIYAEVIKIKAKDLIELLNGYNLELFELVEHALEQAQKQENMLNKIKAIINRPDDSYISSMLEESKRYVEIIKLIKELENE